MMKNVYPEAPPSSSVTPIAENAIVPRIIAQMDAGKTKAEAIGPCLQGSDDVATFNRLWAEIEAEGKALRRVSVESARDETEYRAELAKVAKRLDVDAWIAGIKAEKGAKNFSELKSAARSVNATSI